MRIVGVLLFFQLILLSACGEDETSPSLDDFCVIKPDGWECEIIEDHFDENDIPRNTKEPLAIIKYSNMSREFEYFGQEVCPSLTLDIYSIEDKKELLELISEQMIFSWCIPTYYGETRDFFVVTSPCFINYGSFSEEADSCINDLHQALDKILSKKEYFSY